MVAASAKPNAHIVTNIVFDMILIPKRNAEI